jgi:sulfate permease, SulP family
MTAPVFASLREYRRSWAMPDLLAAVALFAIAVPAQLATSRLAGMPPITGLYAFIAGSVLFALLGSNPHLSVGADSTIAPLFAVGIAHLAPAGSPHYIALVGILAVMAGALVALVGLLRLGWIAEFLSAPIISGFLAGVAVIIVVHQAPSLLGLPAVGGTTLHRLRFVATHLGDTHGWALGIGASVVALVIAAKLVDRRLPGALAGLIGSTLIVAALGAHAHGVAVLGTVAHGVPHLGLSGLSWSAISSVAPVAAAVALVIVTQSAATTRAFADQGGYALDLDRDFVGIGAGSVVAGLVGSFPVNASPPSTAAVASARGRTQAASLLAAVAMAVVVLAAGLLHDVPLATLAAVLISVAGRLFHLRDLVAIARFDRFELGLALVTLLTVALVGVEQGIGVAVALAILDRARLSARPQLHVLGRIPGSTSWAPLSSEEHVAQVPDVLVVLFATPLWFANAEHFRAQLEAALARALGTPRLVVLDALGMGDIDYTGSLALRKVLDELEGRHIGFAVARAGQHARESLSRSGLLARIGEDHLFPSVDEAVTRLGPEAPGART